MGEAGARPAQSRELALSSVQEKLAQQLAVDQAKLNGLDPEMGALISRRLRTLGERAVRDEVTGALRRSAGRELLEREIARAARSHSPRLAIAFLDVDDLKAVNDSQGHSAGDRLLATLARVLRRRLRSYDLVIRWGGDEFVCVLPDAGQEAAERLLRDVSEHFHRRTGRSFSSGVASLHDRDTPESLVARADTELYAARRRRRGPGRWTAALVAAVVTVVTVGALVAAGQGPLAGARSLIEDALTRFPGP